MNGQEFLLANQALAERFSEIGMTFATDLEEWYERNRPLQIAVDGDNVDYNDPAYQMDLALLRAAPVATVPKFGEFQPLHDNGHRFLLAGDGLHLEVRRPWLHFIHRIAKQTLVSMPFGQIEAKTELAFERLGNAMPIIRDFTAAARAEMPNEWADMIVWNDTDKMLVPGNVEILDHVPTAVRYRCRELQDHESLAIDLHSHGAMPAFFSSIDNVDDAGSVKISGVIGNLDWPEPTVAFRLCVLGLYVPINVPAARIFGQE